ncbi:MAG: FAD-dependent oxidoreductase [Kiritimatiellae bacterium]|nr:FAD-dependent oxidoreductase [Kiritimatiellia bacterium]
MRKFNLKSKLLALALLQGVAVWGSVTDLYVECENFTDLGGWTLDPSSMGEIGSSYVMAHGYGEPVADAVTTLDVQTAGVYHVWARTRNWAGEWTSAAPGRFRILLDGRELPAELGVDGRDWHWVEAGAVDLSAGRHRLALHDLTGFNGRCDAVALVRTASDEAALEALRRMHQAPTIREGGTFDFLVAGGGISGLCAAQAAARGTMRTLLLQDRDVVGGCNSSEVRVGLGGDIHVGENQALGNVVESIAPILGGGSVDRAEDYEDRRKLNSCRAGVQAKYLSLRTGERVYAVETNGVGAIAAVVSRNTRTGARTRWRARLFCDATGDAVLARLAGCATMYGREARSAFGEISAPVQADRLVMGHSIQWTTRKEPRTVPFPDISAWALAIDESSATYSRTGGWAQEAGQYRDMARETETIRDWGLLAIFSNWHYLKNVSPRKGDFARDRFSWISPIGGKREGCRVVGDYVFTQNDLEGQRTFPDGTAAVTWDIDQHFPDPRNAAAFKEPFRSCAYHRGFGPRVVSVPYRCLYARNCPNLFLAGRHISVSHVALAAVRVQRTLGMLAEAVGLAATLCWELGVSPRALYADHLPALKARLKVGVPKNPAYHAYPQGLHEKYHFWGSPQVRVYPDPATNLPSAYAAAIKSLGMVHRNEHPCLKTPAARPPLRRLVLADEARPRVLLYDTSRPSALAAAVDVERPVKDLARVGGADELKYRIVCRRGFMVVDLKAQKVVDVFRDEHLNGAEAVMDLPNGGFCVKVVPPGAKSARPKFLEYDAARQLVATHADYAFPERHVACAVRASGHVYRCHPQPEDVYAPGRAPHLGEYDACGREVWRLDDWEFFGSLVGVDVLSDEN